MYRKEIDVVNPSGLHARPASDFVGLAKTFHASIKIGRAGEEEAYNAKSIIMLMSLGLEQGEKAVLTAEGEDEQQAVDALAALVATFTD